MENDQMLILDAARTAASDRCTVSVHVGDRSHRAIRVAGCFAQDARDICSDISKAIEPFVFDKHQYPAVVVQAGIALVWWR